MQWWSGKAKEFLRKGAAKALKNPRNPWRSGRNPSWWKSWSRDHQPRRETDFVARNESFKALLQTLGGQVLSQGSDALMEQQLVDGGGTIQDLINGKVAELEKTCSFSMRPGSRWIRAGRRLCPWPGKSGLSSVLKRRLQSGSKAPAISPIWQCTLLLLLLKRFGKIRWFRIMKKSGKSFLGRESGKPEKSLKKWLKGGLRNFSRKFVWTQPLSGSENGRPGSRRYQRKLESNSTRVFIKYQFRHFCEPEVPPHSFKTQRRDFWWQQSLDLITIPSVGSPKTSLR